MIETLSFDMDINVSVFETNIRGELIYRIQYIILCIAVRQSYQLKMVVDPKNVILINNGDPKIC